MKKRQETKKYLKKLILPPPINKKLLTKDANAMKRLIIASIAGIISIVILIKFRDVVTFIYLITAVILIAIILHHILPLKCSRDGLKLIRWKTEDGFYYYRCSKGHILRKNITFG